MIRFGLIGTGWRAEFFLRITRACPEHFEVTGIVGRTPEKTAALGNRFAVPVYDSVEALVQVTRPDYVVLSVARGDNLPLMTQLAAMDMPMLCETPAGETLDEMRAIWALAEQGARIQIAEQFWAQPHHAARIAFVRSGKLGTVTQAQISVNHGYHAMSLMRRFLNVMFEPVTVNARSFESPIVKSPGRAGLPDGEIIETSTQTIAHFDFGNRLGVFDHTGDQYFSFIRRQRVLVRGERGELVDESAVYLQDYRTPIRVDFVRHSAGINGNLEGNYLKGIQAGESWVYHNPLAPASLSDEEIAIGTCMLGMADYIADGTPVYSLAEGCQDRYLDLLMEQALSSGEKVTSEPQPWQS